MNYREMSAEGLEALVKELQGILREKRGEPAKETLRKILDAKGPDFLGTGLTFEEFLVSQDLQRYRRSYSQQDRKERKRRLDFVLRLAVEYQAVVQRTLFSTAFAKNALAEVFDGDWRGLKIARDVLTFEDETPETRETFAPIFAAFVRLLDEILTSVPTEGSEVVVRH
jgi:hypothetical protein